MTICFASFCLHVYLSKQTCCFCKGAPHYTRIFMLFNLPSLLQWKLWRWSLFHQIYCYKYMYIPYIYIYIYIIIFFYFFFLGWGGGGGGIFLFIFIYVFPSCPFRSVNLFSSYSNFFFMSFPGLHNKQYKTKDINSLGTGEISLLYQVFYYQISLYGLSFFRVLKHSSLGLFLNCHVHGITLQAWGSSCMAYCR